MIAFGSALTGIREQVSRDLARRGLPREKVLAAVVQLLDSLFEWETRNTPARIIRLVSPRCVTAMSTSMARR